MYVTKILLPMSGPKTDLEVLRDIFSSLHNNSMDIEFGIVFPKMKNDSFGNQINIFHKNREDMNSHLFIQSSSILSDLPSVSCEVTDNMIQQCTEYISLRKDNKAKHCSKSGVKSSLKFLEKHPNMEITNKKSRLFHIKLMRDSGLSVDEISNKLHKMNSLQPYLKIQSNSSGMSMRIDFAFSRKKEAVQEVDWNTLTSYGLSSGDAFFPVL